MDSSKIAIIVVAYNRLSSLNRLLQSLDRAHYAHNVDLIISIDKSETNLIVDFSNQFIWKYGKKIVYTQKVNLGLKRHMLSLGKWFDLYDTLVILEDDIIVSECFFRYVTEVTEKYYYNTNIAGASLYNFNINYQTALPFKPIQTGYDVYFMQCAMSWGEIWFKNQWLEFYDWYKKHEDFEYSKKIPQSLFNWGDKSWLKYHTRYCIENEKYFIYPYVSYSTNFSDVGENHKHLKNFNPTVYQVPMQHQILHSLVFPQEMDDSVKYDGFFENEGLSKRLGINSELICINLNKQKQIDVKHRYLLTTELLDYKVIKSYALTCKPIDENIIYDIPGSDIYLYDLQQKVEKTAKNKVDFLLYSYEIGNIPRLILNYGLKKTIKQFLSSFLNRIL